MELLYNLFFTKQQRICPYIMENMRCQHFGDAVLFFSGAITDLSFLKSGLTSAQFCCIFLSYFMNYPDNKDGSGSHNHINTDSEKIQDVTCYIHCLCQLVAKGINQNNFTFHILFPYLKDFS